MSIYLSQMGKFTSILQDKPEPVGDVTEVYIREALAQVDINAVRLALCQLQGNTRLEAMPVTKVDIGGGILINYVLSGEDQEIVCNEAVKCLLQEKIVVPPPISKEESFRLMDLYGDRPLSSPDRDPGIDYEEGYEELAFDEFPRDVKWTNGSSPPEAVANWKVIVVGAGINGISAAIQLKRSGIPFEVLERQGAVGGTWLLNSYPNVRVDSPSYLFQYRFTKKWKWSEYFAGGGEIKDYLQHVAREFGVMENMTFDCEVTSAVWDGVTALWAITTRHKDGTSQTQTCNAILSASGLFSTPNLPDINGISSFKGPIFHTSQWDHTLTYTDKNIALLGTGSTGTQLAPALAQTAKNLTVFQRTPNWIVGFPGFRTPVSEHVHWFIDNMPYYWNWSTYGNFNKSLRLGSLQTRDPAWVAGGGLVNKRNDAVRKALLGFLDEKLSDRPDLKAKVTPTHAPMIRRMVVDNGFYDAIKRDNVDLITDGIDCITETGILTKDGKEHAFDIIVLGAGFKVSQYLWPVNYVGRDNMTLAKSWEKDGARSYLGLTMPNYPNLFMFYGPNHQPRGGSFFSFSEIWARYAVSSIVGMIEQGVKSMEVKEEVFTEYNSRLDEAVKGLVWESEGAGYFVNEHGRQGVNMPWTNQEYHPLVREVNFGDFILK